MEKNVMMKTKETYYHLVGAVCLALLVVAVSFAVMPNMVSGLLDLMLFPN